MSDQQFNAAEALAASNMQIREYFDIARRRKMWVILISLSVIIATVMVARGLPNIYRAETVILVDPQKVPDSYVPSTVSSSITDRLSTIRQQVMSPSQLTRLIDELGLFPELRKKLTDQDLIARMQKATTIEVVDSGGQRLSAFRIAFSGSDPRQVAEVTNRLASMFTERNLKARQQQFNGTAEFLDNELQETKHQLEEKERQLQDLKARYIMDLPESKQYHLEAMNSLRDKLRNSQDLVSRDRQSKVYLQSMSGLSAPTVEVDGDSSASTSPYQAQLRKLETQLRDLQVRYGPNYPDVRKVQSEINKLKAKAAAEKPTMVIQEQPANSAQQHRLRNPVVEAELNKLDQEIESQTKIQADLENQIQYHVSKLQQVPIFEQQISGLMRDYDALRNHYSQLQDKKLSAQMASELETQEAGERFVILDPATPPDRPFGPNRALIIGGGIIMGLLCGIGVAVLVELSDQSVRHEQEAAKIFGKPVLAGVPQIITEQQRFRRRWQAASLIVGTSAVAAGIGLVISRVIASV